MQFAGQAFLISVSYFGRIERGDTECKHETRQESFQGLKRNWITRSRVVNNNCPWAVPVNPKSKFIFVKSKYSKKKRIKKNE